MTEEMAVKAFAAVARNIILMFYPPNSCVVSSLIAMKCLEKFGVKSSAAPFKWFVQCSETDKGYIVGTSREEKETLSKHALSFTDLGESETTWNGHVIVGTENYLIDAAFDQAEVGANLRSSIVVLPRTDPSIPLTDIMLQAEFITDDGITLSAEYTPLDDWSFQESLAWEEDPVVNAIVSMICSRMREYEAKS